MRTALDKGDGCVNQTAGETPAWVVSVFEQISEKRLASTFLDLVRINSPSGSERAIADELVGRLRELGLNVREDDSGKDLGTDTGNVVGHFAGTAPHAPTIALVAHMDTVVANLGVDPQEANGVIRTDGRTILGADDKAGIAAILEAVQAVQTSNEPHGDVYVIFTVSEETGLDGAKRLDIDALQLQCAFVLDSGGSPAEVIGAAPYEFDFVSRVHGKAAHSGVNPEDGVNALAAAALAVSHIRQGRIDEETTVNVGMFHAGNTTNTVCDYAELSGEARSLSREKVEREIEAVKAAFVDASSVFGAKAEVEVSLAYEGFRLQESDEVVRAAFQAVRNAGLNPRLVPRGGGSDTNVFNACGVPAVNLGVGAKRDHTVWESVAVADLLSAARIVGSLIVDFAAGQTAESN